MFKRPHHQRILRLLQALDHDLFTRAQCYFGGGTAIVLALDEYRESIDVDFLCASENGYRALRDAVYERGLDGLTRAPLKALRELRTDQCGIRTFIDIDGVAVKFEIVREARISLTGAASTTLGVPVLSHTDMYAEKLLANADRFNDPAVSSRDIIDLAMLIAHWGPIPEEAWEKVRKPYGVSADGAYRKAILKISDRRYLCECLGKMQMDEALADVILATLVVASV